LATSGGRLYGARGAASIDLLLHRAQLLL